jgi:ribosomal protein L11 methyltransferase
VSGWLRLTFLHAASVEDELAVILHEQGCLGTEAAGGSLRAWFPAGVDAGQVEAAVRREPELRRVRLGSVEEEPDGAWHERWMASLAPIPVGERWLIVPGAVPPELPPDRIPIRLTPGRAFGTGEHATTRMCLELMERLHPAGGSVLDVGTGSGILAIAAWHLGCRPVTALDTDAEAVAVAARNAKRNGCAGEEGIRLVAGPLESIAREPADAVLANLTAATLERLMPELAARAGRTAIFSGILRDEEERIAALARAERLHLLDARRAGDWCALAFGREHV